MKTFFLNFFLLSLSILSFGQSVKGFNPEPKDMVFVPQGCFSPLNDTTKISVDAFWLSNEITNKEFREFTDYAMHHPLDSLYWVEYNKLIDSNLAEKKKHIKRIAFNQILNDVVDSMALSKEYPLNSDNYNKYKNYFTNKAFEEYPVVGVSQKGAKLYCLWKTNIENEKMKKDKLPFVLDYRLPQEMEWSYAANYCNGSEGKTSDEIQKVKFGKSNKLGLYNLFGNVSEWTATSENEKIIVKGESWKESSLKNPRILIDSNLKTSYIGFRIVRSYLGEK